MPNKNINSSSSFFLKQGFTLIELLVVIAIIIALAAASLPIYGSWQSSAQTESIAEEIALSFRQAKIRSEAGFNNSRHGVYFVVSATSSEKFILYQGSTYAGRDAGLDVETEISGSVTLTSTITGNEVNFTKGLGSPTATGTITISHEASGVSNIISINNLGAVEINQ